MSEVDPKVLNGIYAAKGGLSEYSGSPLRMSFKDGCALVLFLLSTALMNTSIFPAFDDIFTYARDISVLCNALALLILGMIVYRHPDAFSHKTYLVAIFLSFVFGVVLMIGGLFTRSAPMLVLGASLVAIGRAIVIVLVGLALSMVDLRVVGMIVAVSVVLQCLVEGISRIPFAPALFLYIVLPLISILLVKDEIAPIVGYVGSQPSPADLSITRPTSFLSPFSALLICLFIFRVTFGFSLRFDEAFGVPRSSLLSAIPAIIVVVYLFVSKRKLPTDRLVQISSLFIIAGLLLALKENAAYSTGAVLLLSAGNALFDMASNVVLIAIASRNYLGALSVLAWGHGLCGIGSIVGAACGVFSNRAMVETGPLFSAEIGFFIPAIILLAFVAYILIGLKGFSFQATVEGVMPVGQSAAADTGAEDFEARCRAIASDHNLTPREEEVFIMLARGRNREFIEKELVVSRNTVKAHVKHIYSKLNIHSHQELIDLVE